MDQLRFPNRMVAPTPPPQPHIIRRIFSFRVLMVSIVAIAIAITAYLTLLYTSPTSPADVHFRVGEKDTVHTIAQRLTTEGVIKHRIFFYFTYYIFGRQDPIDPGGYKLSNTMKVREIVRVLELNPASTYVLIPDDVSKEDIAGILADALGWGMLDRQYFSHTYAGMQWQKYQELIEESFQKQYKWNDTKTHTFLTLSALYYDGAYDFLKDMYVPGTYEIPLDASRAQTAGILIDRFSVEHPDDRQALARFIDRPSADSVVKLIEEQMVLMPDIVAMPAQDMTLKEAGDRTYLQFTTSYWNKGRGPLELIPDESTKGVRTDHDRKIYQRIYSLDGDYTERLSGTFLWHSPHLHYHFQDFAIYELEPLGSPLGAGNIPKVDKQSQKSTFCIRDSEPIDLSHPGADKKASYTICGKERQGISPGWADSYYYTYVDQKFDVTNFPKGTYRLTIKINPLSRFDEITKENNVGEVIFDLDVSNDKITITSEKTYGL